MRYRKDFLEFVKDDIHYTIISLTEFLLNIYFLRHQGIQKRNQMLSFKILIMAHLGYQFFLIFWVYFKKE